MFELVNNFFTFGALIAMLAGFYYIGVAKGAKDTKKMYEKTEFKK